MAEIIGGEVETMTQIQYNKQQTEDILLKG